MAVTACWPLEIPAEGVATLIDEVAMLVTSAVGGGCLVPQLCCLAV